MDNILTVDNLKLYYYTSKGVVKAADDISFFLKKGETLGLVGESGCGKTTTGFALLKMPTPPGKIAGGKIVVDGIDITPLRENEMRRNIRWEKISMVFQGAMNTLTPVYTIGKQMMETLQEHREMERDEARKRIEKYLNLVGLSSDIVKRYPHELSGGMKQRIAIATALFLEPKVIICDEPTTALDVIVQAQIINLLKDLKEKLDLSFIFITHDLATEAEVSDRIAVMYAGKIVEIGTNQQIYGEQGPCHPYTRNLLAATPRLHAKVSELSFIPGAPPDLLEPPSGCRFHPRCTLAMDKCKEEEPPLIEIEEEHMVACWRCEKR
ncbi:peptide ABC transporter ATPase [Mesotoga sp. Brook.08.YT.4.2.5.1]|jgi:peptide/nickel transport system ATP-binding protein|uniref:Oligopeptide/dipeptide ABC transporter, ATP-binding protein n=1 Tax=Mesotoga prima TaxID=1184387 RepID=A0A101HRY7_9BACT|nr:MULTISPECIES: ABC transporter ATP-binding protein [unclassified Mesotoga]KUK81300.1 MAG: Oligopeptide/dipeptide ABC transporter, ATP-binding protein [Mesotoga prima]PNQ05045.1 peptide ABC transporter ATPase [Mesotoga sp. SC_NapDC3]PXF34161.1 peptide ABC transporter ATPase [Mesotoga sp. SC_NapDC]MDD3460602.1 ABC transporter ATP-binding protein [Mesotoga sp.]PNE23472.1 peptide ABC transporter ATPase [Mesotoga sp. Brook.08.YT.4.2.5.1]